MYNYPSTLCCTLVCLSSGSFDKSTILTWQSTSISAYQHCSHHFFAMMLSLIMISWWSCIFGTVVAREAGSWVDTSLPLYVKLILCDFCLWQSVVASVGLEPLSFCHGTVSKCWSLIMVYIWDFGGWVDWISHIAEPPFYVKLIVISSIQLHWQGCSHQSFAKIQSPNPDFYGHSFPILWWLALQWIVSWASLKMLTCLSLAWVFLKQVFEKLF